MPEFESWTDYYDFANYVKTTARHVMDARRQAFLNVVLESAEKRKRRLNKGTALWRAALGQDFGPNEIRDEDGNVLDVIKVPKPYRPNRMKPLSDRAHEGRVNPKGIPCLYLSDDKDTAMTEVRPWIGSHVSLALFVTVRELLLVDCSLDTKEPAFRFVGGGEPDPATRDQDVWWSINAAFSEPVTRTDDVADYASTQVLAELFRTTGCDGIVYGSNLGKGKNVAVFDLSAAELVSCQLHHVEGVNFTFSEVCNPYFIERYAE